MGIMVVILIKVTLCNSWIYPSYPMWRSPSYISGTGLVVVVLDKISISLGNVGGMGIMVVILIKVTLCNSWIYPSYPLWRSPSYISGTGLVVVVLDKISISLGNVGGMGIMVVILMKVTLCNSWIYPS